MVQNETVKGQVVNLLRVAAEESVDPAVRQVASISFKNLVKKAWDRPGDDRCTYGGVGAHAHVHAPSPCMGGSAPTQPCFLAADGSADYLIPADDKHLVRENLLESLIRWLGGRGWRCLMTVVPVMMQHRDVCVCARACVCVGGGGLCHQWQWGCCGNQTAHAHPLFCPISADARVPTCVVPTGVPTSCC